MEKRARHLGFRLLLLTILGVTLGYSAPQQANKPLSEQEVMDLVHNYVPTERIVELVHQFGIGFEPSDQYLKSLRKAGAGKELIGALRAVKPVVEAKPGKKSGPGEQSQPSHAGDPLSQQQISTLLSNHIPSEAIAELVEKYGISFDPTQDLMSGWKKSGADQSLLDALQKARRLPAPGPPAKPEAIEVAQKTPEPAKQQPAPTAKQEVRTVAPAAPEHPGPYNVGGEVSPPVALYAPNAPYTEQARRTHVQGTVVLALVINEHGKVTDISVLSKPLGNGLEESAVRTVATWVFRPARFRGNPVPVRVNVQVGFHQQN
jgi:TonB family protein